MQVHQNSCPVDRQPLTRNYLVDAPRVLRELLADLEVRCEFSSRGCDRYVKMDEHDKHAKQCMYNPNYPIKAKFETILRAKVSRPEHCTKHTHHTTLDQEIITGSHSCVSQLLHILEEKEKLVKEQEKLITKILEEGEDINKLVLEFTNEKEKMQREREEDMQKFRVSHRTCCSAANPLVIRSGGDRKAAKGERRTEGTLDGESAQAHLPRRPPRRNDQVGH